MTSLTQNAIVAQVPFGTIEIEGLILETGDFAVGVSQIASLFPYFHDSQSQASQKLKRLMGKDIKTHKVKAFGQRKYSLAISLVDFEFI